MKRKVLPYLPVILILSAILGVYLSGAYHIFNFAFIQQKHMEWKSAIQAHPFSSALYFIAIYTASVCLILPDSIFLSLVAGFLFPFPLAALYIVFSETLGATLFLAAVEMAFRKQSAKLVHIRKSMQKNQVYYVLFFRFSHLLPFWVINTACAFMNMRKWTFIWTTSLGVLPLALVMAQGGAGLSQYFDQHTHFSIATIFTPQAKLFLIGLGCLALIPCLIPYLKRKHG